MRSEIYKNSLSLTYKVTNDEGKTSSKTLTINNLNAEVSNEKAYEIALLVKDLMAYANEKIIKKREDLLLED